MKTKSFAFALLRVMAIWLLVKYVLSNLFSTIIYTYQASTNKYTSFELLNISFILPIIMLVFWGIIAWFLWFRADGLSNKLVISDSVEGKIESIKTEKIVHVSILVIGFYVLVQAIPEFIQQLLSAINLRAIAEEYELKRFIISTIKFGVSIIIGLFCILKAENIKNLISRLKG